MRCPICKAIRPNARPEAAQPPVPQTGLAGKPGEAAGQHLHASNDEVYPRHGQKGPKHRKPLADSPRPFNILPSSLDVLCIRQRFAHDWQPEEHFTEIALPVVLRRGRVDAGAAHLVAGTAEDRANAVFRHADHQADLVVALALEMVHAHHLGFGALQAP